MRTTRLAIIGAGLGGLYAAWLLEQSGFQDYVLLEARELAGGRIASEPVDPAAAARADAPFGIDRMDLGPTWFWPELQGQLDRLVQQLGLGRFEQFDQGDTVVERSPVHAPVRVRGYANAPAAMRLHGGMATLVEALQRLPAQRLLVGEQVRRLRCTGAHVELQSDSAKGCTTWQAEHVLLALPPRLAVHGIEFTPALPPELQAQWQGTPTWMAPHAKYIAVYEQPFWRAQGLSGQARSAYGPLAEVHDASMPGGSAALFGFVGLPASVRGKAGEAVLKAHCRAQLARLFGPQAAAPRAEFFKDWALDPRTATPADAQASGHHGAAPPAAPATGPWTGRITGIASEWSQRFPGYVAGAIDAAHEGVSAWLGATSEPRALAIPTSTSG